MIPAPLPEIAAVLDAHGPNLSASLHGLRRLILEAAAEQPRIGPLLETLKWGEPAWLPQRPRTGTTVRINALKDRSGGFAAFFHCQTNLVATFRQLYPDLFRFEGNRALVFGPGAAVPQEAFRHCVALALSYHLRG